MPQVVIVICVSVIVWSVTSQATGVAPTQTLSSGSSRIIGSRRIQKRLHNQYLRMLPIVMPMVKLKPWQVRKLKRDEQNRERARRQRFYWQTKCNSYDCEMT